MTTIEELELAYGATCWDDINEARDFGSKAIALCRSLQQQLAEREAEVARLSNLLGNCAKAMRISDGTTDWRHVIAAIDAALAPSGEGEKS